MFGNKKSNDFFNGNIPSTLNVVSEANMANYIKLAEKLENDVESILLLFLKSLNLGDKILLYKIEKDSNGVYTPKQVIKKEDGTIEYKDC